MCWQAVCCMAAPTAGPAQAAGGSVLLVGPLPAHAHSSTGTTQQTKMPPTHSSSFSSCTGTAAAAVPRRKQQRQRASWLCPMPYAQQQMGPCMKWQQGKDISLVRSAILFKCSVRIFSCIKYIQPTSSGCSTPRCILHLHWPVGRTLSQGQSCCVLLHCADTVPCPAGMFSS